METLNDCFELVRKRGTVLAFGVPDQHVYAVEYETFFRKNAHLDRRRHTGLERVPGEGARLYLAAPRRAGHR